MSLDLSILYRGPLSSCNYDCHYCPFAKHYETPAELAVDRKSLERFTNWVATRTDDSISILFTPWGEALTRRWYRESMTELSKLPHLSKVAIQTNLTCSLNWLAEVNKEKLALWCTWHPSQIERKRFVARCHQLDELEIRYSVGVVGLKENYEGAVALRSELSPHVYFWVNAFKQQPNYYSPEELAAWHEIDPHFLVNTERHPSEGKACRTGETVISVDGDGDIRRCHFIKDVIGNIYTSDLSDVLKPRLCTNATCGCHIGYIHLEELGQSEVYGDGLLERIPAR